MNLSAVLDQGLTLETCMWYTQQIISGLQELHRRLFAHLDIKPTNIMIKDNGYLCLIDFGHSMKIPQGSSQVVPWMTCGTLGYQAPELATQPLEPHKALIMPAAADVYSLARTMLDLYLAPYKFDGNLPRAVELVGRRSEAAAIAIYWVRSTISSRSSSRCINNPR